MTASNMDDKNEPLTIDDLLDMHGEPVFVVMTYNSIGSIYPSTAWMLVRVVRDDVWLLDVSGNIWDCTDSLISGMFRRPPIYD